MKIYTKTGDAGETSLLGGSRVPKSHTRIHSYGTIDELNSNLGLVGDQEVNQSRIESLKKIQNCLFVIGSHLAVEPGTRINLPKISEQDVEFLEQLIDEMEKSLPEMKNFILPGGHASVSIAHIARSVCRRAERWIIKLNSEEKVDPVIIKYVNRLSDFLFVLSRKNATELNITETPWMPEK